MHNAGPRRRLPPVGLWDFPLKSHSSGRGDAPPFLLLLTKDKLHSMPTTGRSNSVAMAVGEQIQNPSFVLRRGVWGGGEWRVEPTLLSLAAPPEAAGRQDPQVFHPNTLPPHFGPRKKKQKKKLLASVAPAALATSASQIPRSV